MSPTCAKCGAFGGYEREACGFPLSEGRGGGICDGRVFTDKHELQRAKDALWWESCLAKEQAEATRLRAALSEIAALQTEDVEETEREQNSEWGAYRSGYRDGTGHGRYEASSLARTGLVKP